jgi:hypothetical protein
MKKSIATDRYQFFLFITLMFLPGCVHRRHVDRQKLHINLPTTTHAITHTDEPPAITIWVHGTLMFYTPTYHLIFGGKSCLMPIAAFPEEHHFRVLAETIAEHDPEHFPLQEFYVFGWSGKLQQQEREKAAEKLHQEIIILREEYQKKYGVVPTIRIIAHSHGGNVALNMAKVKCAQPPVLIKSLILLACPVQEKTMHLISTPMFNRVYSLYSSFDIIQILAPQFRRLRPPHEYNPKHRKYHYKIIPFSARLFPVYSHLTQTKIKINNYPISHTSFSTKEFTTLLPTILQKLDSWHDESLATNKISKHKLLCIYKNQQAN